MTANQTLGRLLRGIRLRKNWTLKEMSLQTGIPQSTLSKVEHDRLTLTYDKLLQLGQGLGMHISELLAEPGGPVDAVVTGRRSIGQLDQSVRVNTRNYDYYYFCPELRRKQMVPILTRLHARSIEEFGELVHHAGEEFIYVVEGRIEVHTEFYDPVILDLGESIYFDSRMGHAYVIAEGCDEATVLCVCSSADERFMEPWINGHGQIKD